MTATVQELFELTKAAGRLPDPKAHPSTPEQPILEVQVGEINHQPAYAYGVVRIGIGVTGVVDNYGRPTGALQNVTYYAWDWYFDRKEALEVANFRLWLDQNRWTLAEETENLQVRIGNGRTSWNDLRHPVRHEVTPLTGHPFPVFQIVVPMGFGYDLELCLGDKVCEHLHHTLLVAHKGGFEKRIEVDEEASLSEVIEEDLDVCSHCGATIRGYQAIIHFSPRWYTKWFGTEEEAETARQGAETERQRIQTEKMRREEDQAVKDLMSSLFMQACNLRTSPKLAFLSIFVNPDLIRAFEENYDNLPEHTDPVPYQLQGYARMEASLLPLQAELDRVYEERYLKAIDVVTKLERLLDEHFPTCLLCGAPYARDEASLLDLLVYGKGRLSCQCPEHGWGHYREDETGPTPSLINEVRRFSHTYDLVPPVAYPFFFEDTHSPAIGIKELEVDGRMAVSFVLVNRNTNFRPGLVVNLDALALNGDVRVVNTWAKMASQKLRELQDALEAESKKEPDFYSILKLRLQWDYRRPQYGWHAFDGRKRYQVHALNDHAVGQDGGWYYCRLNGDIGVRTPEGRRADGSRFGVNDPDHLVIVTPVMPIWSKNQPRS